MKKRLNELNKNCGDDIVLLKTEKSINMSEQEIMKQDKKYAHILMLKCSTFNDIHCRKTQMQIWVPNEQVSDI